MERKDFLKYGSFKNFLRDRRILVADDIIKKPKNYSKFVKIWDRESKLMEYPKVRRS